MLRDRSANLVHNARELVDDRVIREAQHLDSCAHEAVVSASVVCLPLDVDRAVDLDHEVAFMRVEIRDITEKWALTAERRAGLTIPQLPPEHVLLVCHSSTESARMDDIFDGTWVMTHERRIASTAPATRVG